MTLEARSTTPRRYGPETGLIGMLQRMATGEEAALAEFYDAAGPCVYGLAVRILHDAAAAEEVTLDIFYQAWHQAGRFDARRGSAKAWLMTIARNRAIDRLRSRQESQRREASLEGEARRIMDPRPGPQTEAMLADHGARVRRALAELSAEQREVIELAFFEGLSHGQIAQRLGNPLGTVKTRIRLGIRHLAEKLLPEEQS